MTTWPTIEGWAYDADQHCPDCARERFGNAIDNQDNPPEDSEGNPITPIFSTSELFDAARGTFCGSCRAEIREPLASYEVDSYYIAEPGESEDYDTETAETETEAEALKDAALLDPAVIRVEVWTPEQAYSRSNGYVEYPDVFHR